MADGDGSELADWASLTNLLAKVDGTEEFYEAEDLAEELRETGVDPALDTIGAWQDGALVGFGQLRVSTALLDGEAQAHINGGVQSAARRRTAAQHMAKTLSRRCCPTSSSHSGCPARRGSAWSEPGRPPAAGAWLGPA